MLTCALVLTSILLIAMYNAQLHNTYGKVRLWHLLYMLCIIIYPISALGLFYYTAVFKPKPLTFKSPAIIIYDTNVSIIVAIGAILKLLF